MASRPALVMGDDGMPQRMQAGDSIAGDVSYAVPQSLTPAQQAQALSNIGAVDPVLSLLAQQGQAAIIQAQLNLGVLTPGQVLAIAIAN